MKTIANYVKPFVGNLVFVVSALSLCVPQMALATTYTVAEGETFVLDSGSTTNASANRIDITGSATLKLTGSATNGAFPLKLHVRFTTAAQDARLTVDVSEVADCTSIRMTGDTRDNSGSAVVMLPSTIGEFIIGDASRGAHDAKNFASFDIDVSFAGEGRVVFTNDVTVAKLPTCSWQAAPGSRVATFGPLLLGNSDFTLSDYDVELCHPGSFAAASSLTVPPDRTLYVRPCRFNNDTGGTWIGTSTVNAEGAGYTTNNVVLGGSGAQMSYENGNAIYGINGTISGTGDVYVRNTGNVYMRGAFDWSGSLTVDTLGNQSQQVYVFYPTNCAMITPGIVVNHPYGGDLRFYPTGSTTGSTELRLTSVAGNGTSRFTSLRVSANQTMTVGELSGSVRIVRGGDGAKLVVESLAANATIYLPPDLDFTVKAVGSGAAVVLESAGGESEEWFISGPAAGDAASPSFTFPDNAAASALSLGGRLAFPSATSLPFGAVTVLAGADVSANIADGTKVVNNGGTLTQLVKTWRDKVTLWTDASDASTFTYAKVAYTNELGGSEADDGFTGLSDSQLIEWRDRRGGKTLRFRTTKYDSTLKNYLTTIFPYAQEESGLSSVYFPNNSKVRMRISSGKGTNTTLNVKYALFVFGGQLGGGNAFFCNQTTGYLQRRASQISPSINNCKSLPLVNANSANLAFRTNGVDVAEPTSTKLTGGWQIISFASEDGINLCAISQAVDPDNGSYNGGQIYAEILLFSEMPTEEECEAAETYLAKKWNLPLGHEDVVQKSNVNVALSGSGTVSLAGDAAVSNGMFSGTVNLNGHRLLVSTNALPYTEATIPSDGRVLWIDPSYAGAVVYGGDENKPLEVSYIYARDNSGLLTDPSAKCVASPYSSSVDMRVRTVSGARASGAASTWLDFSNGYGNDNYRNHLQVKKDLSSGMPTSYADTATFVSINVKAGFFALDTTRGGGTAIASTVNGTGGSFKWRNSTSATAPIWHSENAADVKNSDTYLDGVPINAATESYSLRPEVFSFNMQPSASAQAAKVFGYSGTGSSSTVNPEIMGEWLLYSERQSEADRAGIEAYLMKKWLGKLREGFSDFRDMTVSGDGVLAAEGPEYLPTLTAAFTGSLEFSRTVWTFALPRDGGDAALNAVDLSGQTVSIPAEVTVNVDMAGAKAGTYLLMRVGSFSGETEFALGSITGQGNKRVELLVANAEVALKVYPVGAQFIVR